MTIHTLTERLAGGGGPRRRVLAAVGAILVAVIAIGVIVGAGLPGSSKGQSSSGSTASGATTVQRRDLVETDTESGTLGYANQQTVFNRLSGTITYLPNVGAVIKPGGTLYQVDGYPVILFSGSYPAYRDLTSGDSNGPDIEELNADLKAMGFDPDHAITVDQTWQAATTDAVERFQGSIGQSETGTISLGQVVFLPGPQLINAVDTTLGSTGGSAGTGSSSASDSDDSSGASDTSDPTSTATPTSYPIAGQSHAEFVDLSTSSTATLDSAPASAAVATTPSCPTPPATATTPSSDCPAITTPTTTTPTTTTPTTTTPTTTTTPLSTTPPNSSGSTLEAIVKLLETQNRLLQAELKSAQKGSSTTGRSSTGTSSSGSGSAHTGGGSASSSAASSGGSGSSSDTGSSTGASSGAASADAILASSSTDLVVTVDLDATKQSEAVLHEPVTVELPDGSTVNGKITGVSPVAQSSSSSSSTSSTSSSAPSATIPVTVSLEKHTDTSALDQAAVSVNFEEQVANNVLSVPVTALLATQGGGYAVQEAAPPHKLIAVTPGLFAAGYVQISGPDVQDGMQVTDSQG